MNGYREGERISVIIPVFNVERYLDKCIDSVLRQSYKKLEIILVDDGSTDRSLEICRRYQEADKRIRVAHQENRGLSAARNTGLDLAQGELVYFLDSDDSIHPEAIRILYENMKDTGAEIAVAGLAHVKEDGTRIEKAPEKRSAGFCVLGEEALQYIYSGEYREAMVIACGKLYRKNLWEKVRFPEGKYHEDEYVAHHILGSASKVVYVDDALYYYLVRRDSITGQSFQLKHLDVGEALWDRICYFREKGYAELTIRAEEVYLWWLIESYCRMRKYQKRETVIQRQLQDEFKRLYGGRKIRRLRKRIYCGLFNLFPKQVAWIRGFAM